MMYEQYQKKIEKRYYYKRLIFKYRILISSLLILFSVLTISYIATKGMVYGISYEDELIYGEQVNLSSKSVFSDTSYKYRNILDINWSNELPTTPGSYEVLIETKGVFGNTKNKTISFVISNKVLNPFILEDKVEFGTNPVLDLEEVLVEGDYIDNVSYEYDDLSLTKTNIKLDSIVIKNKQGIDVTNFYNISSYQKNIEFIPRNITLSADSKTIEYDSLEHVSTGVKVLGGSLVEGDYIVNTNSAIESTIGMYDNNLEEVTIFNSDDIDVTANYSINITNRGYLEITKRFMKVQLLPYEGIYDGSVHTSDAVDPSYRDYLLEGHEIEYNTTAESIYVGRRSNYFKDLVVIDKDNKDVSDLYNLNTIQSYLIVNKRELHIQTGSLEHDYNKEYVSTKEYEIINDTSLVLNDYIDNDYIYISSYINSGIYNNTFYSIDIFNDELDSNINDNYDIIYTIGTITINKANITVSSYDIEKEYDGSSYYYNGNKVEVTSGSIFDDGLDIEHNINDMYNAGEYLNLFSAKIYTDYWYDNSNNYNIEYEFGILTIKPRDITIQLYTGYLTYDGTEQIYTDHYISSGTLLYNHISIVETNVSLKNVGVVTNEIEGHIIQDYYNDYNDVSINYNVTYEEAELHIVRRDIYLQLEYKEKQYDGEELTSNTLEGLYNESYINNIVFSHSITEIIASGVQIDVGTSINPIESIIILDEEGIEVQSNYNIIQYESYLHIYLRVIRIETASSSKVYDDTELIDKSFEIISETKLVDNDDISITYNTSIIDVYSVENYHEYQIYSNNRQMDVTNNYYIELNQGTLKVEHRTIHIKPVDKIRVYDGEYLYSTDYEYTEQSEYKILDHHWIDYTMTNNLRDVGSIKNELNIYGIYDEYYNYKYHNYQVYLSKGTLTVTPRPITIKTNDIDRIFNNSIYNTLDSDYYISEGTLANNEEYYHNYTNYINVGNYEHDIQISIWNNYENFISTSNYDITYDYGYLNINKYELTIKPTDTDRTYNGEEVNVLDFEVVSGRLTDIWGDITYEVVSGLNPINAGYYNNYIESFIIHDNIYDYYNGSLKVDITSNFDITFKSGIINIEPLNISIKPKYTKVEYNGLYNIVEEYEYFSEFADFNRVVYSDTLVITTEHAFIDVSSTNNNKITSFSIFNNKGEFINDNYIVDYSNPGYFEVYRKEIVIKAKDLTKRYDGTELISNEVEFLRGSLVNNQTINIITNGSQTIIGSSSNRITDYYILNELGYDVSYNYDINTEVGLLTVEYDIAIQVTLDSTTKIYDGMPLHINTFTYSNELGLLEGHLLEITTSPTSSNVGVYKHEDIKYYVYDEDGNDITDFYIIEVLPGTLEIKAKDITITTANHETTYNAEYQHNYSFDYDNYKYPEISYIGLGDYSKANFKDADTYENKFSISIYNNEADISSNYNINYIYGEFIINKSIVNIDITEYEKVFDNTNIFKPYNIHLDGFYEDQLVIEPVLYFYDIHIGANKSLNYYEIKTNLINDKDVSSNYEFILRSYYVDVVRLNVQIELDNSKNILTYNGKYQVNKEIDVYIPSNSKLVEELKFDVDTTANAKDVGWEYINRIVGINSVTNKDLVDVNNDLSIEIIANANEYMIIEPKDLYINVIDKSFKYDGYYHSSDEYNTLDINNKESLIEGHGIHVTTNGFAEQIGLYDNNVVGPIIWDENGTTVNQNYNIIINNGTITIYNEIEIRYIPATYTYDGTTKSIPNEDYYLMEDLPFGYQIVNLEILGSIDSNLNGWYYNHDNIYKEKITYNKDTLKVLDYYGNDVTDYINFIEKEEYYITIQKRKIKYKSANVTLTSDDESSLENQYYALINGSLVEGHTVNFYRPDYSYNLNEFYVHNIFDSDGVDVTHHYIIEHEYGIITRLY